MEFLTKRHLESQSKISFEEGFIRNSCLRHDIPSGPNGEAPKRQKTRQARLTIRQKTRYAERLQSFTELPSA
jgi:hypothetical protein